MISKKWPLNCKNTSNAQNHFQVTLGVDIGFLEGVWFIRVVMRILIRSPEVQYVLLKSHKMGVFSFCLQFCELIQQYGFVFSYVLMVQFIGDPDQFHPYISQISKSIFWTYSIFHAYIWPILYSIHIFDLFHIPSIYLTSDWDKVMYIECFLSTNWTESFERNQVHTCNKIHVFFFLKWMK